MARLMVDASVALKWFVAETGGDHALRLLQSGNDLLAPEYILIELANALRTCCALQRIAEPLAAQVFGRQPVLCLAACGRCYPDQARV